MALPSSIHLNLTFTCIQSIMASTFNQYSHLYGGGPQVSIFVRMQNYWSVYTNKNVTYVCNFNGPSYVCYSSYNGQTNVTSGAISSGSIYSWGHSGDTGIWIKDTTNVTVPSGATITYEITFDTPSGWNNFAVGKPLNAADWNSLAAFAGGDLNADCYISAGSPCVAKRLCYYTRAGNYAFGIGSTGNQIKMSDYDVVLNHIDDRSLTIIMK